VRFLARVYERGHPKSVLKLDLTTQGS
jgi:hypothetical protein